MAATDAQPLPADLFHLLTAELAARQDFATLYSCVASSRYLANAGAITALYRISLGEGSPVKGGGSDNLSFAEQDLVIMRWSIMWRTLILSSLGKTMYPYCRHLRELDLRDLSDLLDRLDEPKFRTKVAKQFFKGDLKQFHHTYQTIGKYQVTRLDIKKILFEIGDQITQHAPLLEGISEPNSSDVLTKALPGWASRLSHLHELELWDGKALADETLRSLVHKHCPRLQHLRIYHSSGENPDTYLATFLGGMPANTLTSFENNGTSGIAAETCLALNNHGKSLISLKLALDEDGMLALGLLQSCTQIEILSVAALRATVDLKAIQNDVFTTIVDWLNQCHRLVRMLRLMKSITDHADRIIPPGMFMHNAGDAYKAPSVHSADTFLFYSVEVSLDGVVSAPDLLLPILLNAKVRLHDLHVTAKEGSLYLVKDHHDFHKALATQKNLRNLKLRADPESVTRDDMDVLLDSLCSLTNLRELDVWRISEYFNNEHIKLLAEHLPLLEVLYLGGYGITDAVWDGISGLQHLKQATFAGLTSFTADGIQAFIQTLSASNSGLVLSVDLADPDYMISDEDQDKLREALVAKVGGRFEYQLLRGISYAFHILSYCADVTRPKYARFRRE
ncbi:hypothetical protein LTR78_000901 [Recurvomyces mirabilis]|uniref:Uncharacterized protein n=1 Tax=Recurvomyces mirabilis TaxID=574656 RepID=A0AAE0WW20_9PEZI|nr:hypothetical protein LTR78_000901 [Recurvomyces mirabilis]KAK5158872.1 hypothetical protein LTS14_002980 [Recurvomyces mirabilis]